ncbi:MAG: hypothetical protein ACYC5O_21335, partial [Anaerolineae bacterium]
AAATESGLRLAGTAVEVPYPSPTRSPLSINVVSAARYRINGGPWHAMVADDGAFDSGSESFTGDLPTAPMGTWQIEVAALNSSGNAGVSITPLTVTDGVAPSETVVNATAVAVGDHGVAGLDGVAASQDGTTVVTAIEYRADSGAWLALDPADGVFDAASEAFSLTVADLSAGSHVFQVRAWTASPWTVAQVWQQSVEVVNTQSPPSGGSLYVPLIAGRQ